MKLKAFLFVLSTFQLATFQLAISAQKSTLFSTKNSKK